MQPVQELARLLRPAGGGLYLVSTGRDAQLALQKRLYDATTEAEVQQPERTGRERAANTSTRIHGGTIFWE